MRAGSVILASIVGMVGLTVLILVGWMAGVFVVPLYEAAMNSSGVQAVGWDTNIATTIPLGIRLALPLIGVVMLIWMMVIALQTDVFTGGGRMR